MPLVTSSDIIITANEASEALGLKIANEMGLEFTKTTKKYFTDGEIYHSFPEKNPRIQKKCEKSEKHIFVIFVLSKKFFLFFKEKILL